MSKLVWDEAGKRLYETGTKNGVLYVQDSTGAYPEGVAWNGLTGFSESPDGGDATEIWADDMKYLSIRAREDFGGTITAYTFPDEWMACDGSAELMPGLSIGQQSRKPFGLSYVTTVGNDTEFEDYGYKIHLIYGATASPSSKDYQTINDSPEAIEFSWDIDTIPVNVTSHKPTAHVVIDSTKCTKAQMDAIEAVLYGQNASEATAATYKKATGTYQATGVDYYTRSGTSPNYTYTKVTTPSADDFANYYVVDTPAHEATTATTARLPLPDEVKSILLAVA
jgi:hypothetical protein